MIAKKLENQKQLMSALLTRDTFDAFELVEGTVRTYAEFRIDGTWHEKFFKNDAAAAPSLDTSDNDSPSVRFTPWQMLRPHFLAVIRGKNTPLSFQFVFRLPEDRMNALFDEAAVSGDRANVTALMLNITFDGTTILLTSGVSHRTFSMDRAPERAWDEFLLRFFSENSLDLIDP